MKEPSGKCFHHLGQLSRSTCVCCAQLTDKFHLGLCLQVRSGTPVCAPQIAPTVCAAPVISGLASASLCCGRDRFARDTAGKGTMAWNCSSAAHVATDSAAELYESWADGLRRPRPGSQHPLHRLATPPPTRRCCLHPQSHHHQQWQRPDFMCARKTREGWMERVKTRWEEKGRKERRKDLLLSAKDQSHREREAEIEKEEFKARQKEGGVNTHNPHPSSSNPHQ